MTKMDMIMETLKNVGYVWKRLDEIANFIKGKQVKKSELSDDAEFPMYSGGAKPTGFYHKSNMDANKIVISIAGTAGFVNRLDVPFWAGASCYVVDVKRDVNVDWRYLYYFLKFNQPSLIAQRKEGGSPSVTKQQ